MSDETESPQRIAKHLASIGVCSRRAAEAMIESGRIKVNGVTIQSPVTFVTKTDSIEVDNQPVTNQVLAPRLWLYYKPEGLVTTHHDPQGRKTVFASLPKDLPRVISVGRLDLNSEGLLLLTTSGLLARYLELPSTGWIRSYRVRIFGRPTQEALEKLKNGLAIDGFQYEGIDITIDHEAARNTWLTIKLREGKNREIRRMMEFFGWSVNRLIRIGYGPFHLGQMEAGELKEVTGKVLREQLGPFAEKIKFYSTHKSKHKQ